MRSQATGMERVQMTLETSLAEGKPIFGVTYLDNELYVLRRRTADIEVYEVARPSYKLTRRLNVSKLRNPLDLAACRNVKHVFNVVLVFERFFP